MSSTPTWRRLSAVNCTRRARVVPARLEHIPVPSTRPRSRVGVIVRRVGGLDRASPALRHYAMPCHDPRDNSPGCGDPQTKRRMLRRGRRKSRWAQHKSAHAKLADLSPIRNGGHRLPRDVVALARVLAHGRCLEHATRLRTPIAKTLSCCTIMTRYDRFKNGRTFQELSIGDKPRT